MLLKHFRVYGILLDWDVLLQKKRNKIVIKSLLIYQYIYIFALRNLKVLSQKTSNNIQ